MMTFKTEGDFDAKTNKNREICHSLNYDAGSQWKSQKKLYEDVIIVKNKFLKISCYRVFLRVSRLGVR